MSSVIPPPIAYIMRGLPGSGKTTLARMLAVPAAICSTDDFFMVDGVYRFDPRKLGINHAANLAKFTTLCREGHGVVVCDNTNMKREHVRVYKAVAEQNGYDVVEVTVGACADPHFQQLCAQRNVHGLDLGKIQKMAAGFEP